jgi:hypothetical protein
MDCYEGNYDISYYGRLDTPLLRGTLGYYLMDELFKKIVDRNNEVLEQNQTKLILALSNQIKVIISKFEKDIDNIRAKLNIEKKKTKDGKNKKH